MSSYNKVILMGNLTRDVEINQTKSGKTVGKFGLAVNEKRRDGKDEVLFIDCVCWEQTASVAEKYLAKGSPVMLDGKLRLEQWEDKQTGSKRQKISVLVERLTFIWGKNDEHSKSSRRQGGRDRRGENEYQYHEDDVPPF